MGSTPPFFTRCTNSVASSIMVKSAAVSVSNTALKPRRRKAATILPSTLVPMGRPKHSPNVARTLGAVCTTTYFSGSFRAAHTLPVSSFSVRAPVGHTVMHCPQEIQGLSPSLASKAHAMCVWNPRSVGPMTPTAWFSRQTATQRRHRIHLLLSRIMCGADASSAYRSREPTKRWPFTP